MRISTGARPNYVCLAKLAIFQFLDAPTRSCPQLAVGAVKKLKKHCFEDLHWRPPKIRFFSPNQRFSNFWKLQRGAEALSSPLELSKNLKNFVLGISIGARPNFVCLAKLTIFEFLDAPTRSCPQLAVGAFKKIKKHCFEDLHWRPPKIRFFCCQVNGFLIFGGSSEELRPSARRWSFQKIKKALF